MDTFFAIVAGVFIVAASVGAVYSYRGSKNDPELIALSQIRDRQEQHDKDQFIEDIAILIDQYHDVIAGYGGKARTQMKREILRNMGAMLPKGAVKMIVPYLEDGMAGENFVIDMNNQPELYQRLIDAR